MLAQSFLTAEALNIPEPHRQALMKTLVLLETGKLVHTVPNYQSDDQEDGAPFSGHFNMNVWSLKHSCGSVGCIGGTAELVGGVKFDSFTKTVELIDLFYPDCKVKGEYNYELIMPSQAAIGLRSYLTTGAANWKEALRL